eukprot:TRINITY_DN10252_c0_g3_i1.p1 TRINITY_DN10252_c0_g3~~TRINITY_DN10252_c0_g3_i1.p1  ORF type:complete len:491 (+),score=194.37 TRINITY_DN10252_c0_g3_i1:1508-2980(+)
MQLLFLNVVNIVGKYISRHRELFGGPFLRMNMKRRSKSATLARNGEEGEQVAVDVLMGQLRQHLDNLGVKENPLDVLREIKNWASAKEAHIQGFEHEDCATMAIATMPNPDITHVEMSMAPLDFMILTHRAIRAGFTKALELLSHQRTVVEGVKLFEQTSRLIDLHTKQEDDVFFPFLKKNMQCITTHDDHHHEAICMRQSLVQKLKSCGVDDMTLQQLHEMVESYTEHMRGEEMEMLPAVRSLTNTDSMQQTGKQLIRYDIKELLTHAVPFTTIQLCRTASYEDGIKLYAKCLKAATTDEAYVGISKVMLMSAFEANKKYAAQLVDENILSASEPINVLPETVQTPLINQDNAIPKTRKGVAAWLERNHKGHWSWKDVNLDRDTIEVDALMRAERLHVKLAERFAEPLNLKHVMIEESTDGAEQTIYFFIDNTWEMARRALFAKLYTRMHKERGKRMHVVIIDAKERRSLAKRDAKPDQLTQDAEDDSE